MPSFPCSRRHNARRLVGTPFYNLRQSASYATAVKAGPPRIQLESTRQEGNVIACLGFYELVRSGRTRRRKPNALQPGRSERVSRCANHTGSGQTGDLSGCLTQQTLENLLVVLAEKRRPQPNRAGLTIK